MLKTEIKYLSAEKLKIDIFYLIQIMLLQLQKLVKHTLNKFSYASL